VGTLVPEPLNPPAFAPDLLVGSNSATSKICGTPSNMEGLDSNARNSIMGARIGVKSTPFKFSMPGPAVSYRGGNRVLLFGVNRFYHQV